MANDGFLGRWSRRKAQARSGQAAQDAGADAQREDDGPVAAITAGSVTPGPTVAGAPQHAAPGSAPPASPTDPDAASAAEPPPTLADVASLTPESDFRRFVARDVDAPVRNAAMKKLFADPHFNVMDRMDVYIDDYATPAPIPPAVLRSLASAQFLNLFDERPRDGRPQDGDRPPADVPSAADATNDPTTAEAATAAAPATDAAGITAPSAEAASTGATADRAPFTRTADDGQDPDLHLQPDDAAGRTGDRPGAGRDPDAA
jgi:hypothetical protein